MKTLLPVLMLAALCGGCETVVFQAPPVAEQACDAALVGNWLSVGDKNDKAGEVELRIAADCTLLFVEHDKGAPREGDPTRLHVGRDGRIAYGWVDAQWADRRMDLKEPAPADAASRFAAGDIVLMRYRVSGRRLELRNASPRQFAHRIVDSKIDGSVARKDDKSMAVRVIAPVKAEQLRDAKLFPRSDMRFTRAGGDE